MARAAPGRSGRAEKLKLRQLAPRSITASNISALAGDAGDQPRRKRRASPRPPRPTSPVPSRAMLAGSGTCPGTPEIPDTRGCSKVRKPPGADTLIEEMVSPPDVVIVKKFEPFPSAKLPVEV